MPLEGDDALKTLSGMYEQLRDLGYNLSYARQVETSSAAAISFVDHPILRRLPIVDEKAPTEKDFDTIVKELRVEGPRTACVFNCQVRMRSYDRVNASKKPEGRRIAAPIAVRTKKTMEEV